MKKSLYFGALALSLLMVFVCCVSCSGGSGSSGSEKVHSLRSCSFALPSSWKDNSTGDFLMYTAPDDNAGLNASFDDQDPEYRAPLSERLDGVDYELFTIPADGSDVYLYVYKKDGLWLHDFEVVCDEGAYHFIFLSDEKNGSQFKTFVRSLVFA